MPDNNAAERQIRPLALGRKNYLFEEWLELACEIWKQKKNIEFTKSHVDKKELRCALREFLSARPSTLTQHITTFLLALVKIKNIPINPQSVKDLTNNVFASRIDAAVTAAIHDSEAAASKGERTTKPSRDDQDRFSNLLRALEWAVSEDTVEARHFGAKRLGVAAPLKETDKLRNLIIQGAGDLSMNEWNVGLWRRQNEDLAVFLPESESFTAREYNCLVVWREKQKKQVEICNFIREGMLGTSIRGNLSIVPVQISKSAPYVRLRGIPNGQNADLSEYIDVGDNVDFAIYGKLILRNGAIVEPIEVIDQFNDLRHIFKLPNINPHMSEADKIYLSKEALPLVGEGNEFEGWLKPGAFARLLFGKAQCNDVWLLEHALLTIPHLARLACTSPVAVRLTLLGAPQRWIDVCLRAAGYIFKRSLYDVKEEV